MKTMQYVKVNSARQRLRLALLRHSRYNVAQKEGVAMAANAVVRARIDERLKEEASCVLEAMGLTASDAFRMLMTRIAREKKLPFSPFEPSAETISAMMEARSGGLKSFNGIDDLMTDLNADA